MSPTEHPILSGIIPHIVTPLKTRDELDTSGLDRLIEHILAGGVHGLFLLGLISRRANNPVAIAAVIFGLLTIVWMTLSPLISTPEWSWFKSPFHSFMIPVFGTLAILIGGIFISRVRRSV